MPTTPDTFTITYYPEPVIQITSEPDYAVVFAPQEPEPVFSVTVSPDVLLISSDGESSGPDVDFLLQYQISKL